MGAIQTIETELVAFFKQREQAIANVHAVDGAIQAAQHLLAKLRAEEAKVVGEVKAVVEGDAAKVETTVESAVETEAKKI